MLRLDEIRTYYGNIQALKGVARMRRRPKGRWRPWTRQFVNLQAIAEESTA